MSRQVIFRSAAPQRVAQTRPVITRDRETVLLPVPPPVAVPLPARVPVATAASVVIAVHGQREVTEDCLNSLFADVPEAEVVVVDNASPDDTRECLARWQPRVQVLPLAQNEGVPKAWNRGLEAASGQVLGVLNNDTIIHPGGLRQLIDAAAEHGIACWMGGRLLPTLDFWGYTVHAQQADYPDGCALFFRRDVWEAVGKFDESYSPCYSEDADWGIRARLQGFRWAVCPDSLTHLGQRTSNTMPGIARARVKSQERLRLKWRGVGIGERFLVRRWGALGDVLMCTPALAALRRKYPLASIHLETDPSSADLLRGWEVLSSVGEQRCWGEEDPTRTFDLDRMYEDDDHAGRFLHPALAAAERLEVGIGREPYHVPATSVEDAWAWRRLPPHPGMTVALALRSAFRPKANWGERQWCDLARARPDWRFVLLDSESQPSLETERKYRGERVYGLPNVLDLTGQTPSPRHALGVLRHCDGVVSVDTGLLHLASAAGVPVVGLFGGAPAHARAPLVGAFRVLAGQAECYPCSCPTQCDRQRLTEGRQETHCLAGVTPELVARQLEGLWRGAG